MSNMFSARRIINQLKRSAMRTAKKNGRVSSFDLRKVMRSQVDGPARGSFISRAFIELINEGHLRDWGSEVNPATKSRVTVYTKNWNKPQK